MKNLLVLLLAGLFSGALNLTPANAAETDVLNNLLESMDRTICSSPKKLLPFYKKGAVLMSDDARISLEEQIEDFERMIAEFEEMKCTTTRTILGGKVGEKIGYLFVDEIVNVPLREVREHRVRPLEAHFVPADVRNPKAPLLFIMIGKSFDPARDHAQARIGPMLIALFEKKLETQAQAQVRSTPTHAFKNRIRQAPGAQLLHGIRKGTGMNPNAP